MVDRDYLSILQTCDVLTNFHVIGRMPAVSDILQDFVRALRVADGY